MRTYVARLLTGVVVLMLGICTTSNAALIILIGGGPTEGWIAPAAPLVAYNLGTSTNYLIQSVNFRGWAGSLNSPDIGPVYDVRSPNISNSSFTPPSYASPDGNDTAMSGMMGAISYSGQNGGAGPLTIIMKGTGFTVGTDYRIDAFTFSSSDRTHERFALNGSNIENFTEQAGVSYLIQGIVTAVTRADLGAGGQITLDIFSDDHLTPVLSGLVVSVATPEPASIGACLVAATVLMMSRRRFA
jgi:hypothetical protein